MNTCRLQIQRSTVKLSAPLFREPSGGAGLFFLTIAPLLTASQRVHFKQDCEVDKRQLETRGSSRMERNGKKRPKPKRRRACCVVHKSRRLRRLRDLWMNTTSAATRRSDSSVYNKSTTNRSNGVCAYSRSRRFRRLQYSRRFRRL